MKNLFKLLAAACLAMTTAACVEVIDETPLPEETFTVRISASAPQETRVQVGELENNSYPFFWEESDVITIEEYIDGAFSQSVSATVESLANDNRSAYFTAQFARKSGTTFDYYASYGGYPYSMTQNPRADSFDPMAISLVAEIEGLTEQSDALDFSFRHELAYAKMTVTGLDVDDDGTIVKYVSFTAKEQTITTHIYELGYDGTSDFTVWFSTREIESIDSFVVEIDTEAYSYMKEFTVGANRDFSLETAVISNFTIDMKNAEKAQFGIPNNNEIHYISTDGEIVKLDERYYQDGVTFGEGVSIVSTVYENGKGVITFNKDVTTIGDSAFSWCSSLTKIAIPNSVTYIGNEAFSGCLSLREINIPNSVTAIGDRAFFFCRSLKEVTIPDSVTSIRYGAFQSCSSLTEITIPDSVTEIGGYAFASCASLKEITIPDSVTEIGVQAFEFCSSLTEITIPDSVTSIGELAFYRCDNLRAFYGKFASDDNRCLILDGVLLSFAPAGLTEYIILDGVTEIGYYAFAGCSSLTEITIPDSVTSIGYAAFNYCRSLKEITIPNSVTEIGSNAFEGCSSLTEIYCKPTTPPTGKNGSMFYEIAENAKIYVPRESVDVYKQAEYWSNYANIIEGYDF